MLLILSLGGVAESRGPKVVHNSVIGLQKFWFQFIRVQTLVCFWVLVSQGLKSSFVFGFQFLRVSSLVCFAYDWHCPKKDTQTHTHKQKHDVSSLAGKVNAYLIWMGIGTSGPKTSEPQCRHADPKFRNPLLEKHAGS